MSSFPENYRGIVALVAAKATEMSFRGRTGHGGGPCSKRVLTPAQLREIIDESCRVAISQVVKTERGGEVPEWALYYQPRPDCAMPGCDNVAVSGSSVCQGCANPCAERSS